VGKKEMASFNVRPLTYGRLRKVLKGEFQYLTVHYAVITEKPKDAYRRWWTV